MKTYQVGDKLKLQNSSYHPGVFPATVVAVRENEIQVRIPEEYSLNLLVSQFWVQYDQLPDFLVEDSNG